VGEKPAKDSLNKHHLEKLFKTENEIFLKKANKVN
jgi:hypothetical protein